MTKGPGHYDDAGTWRSDEEPTKPGVDTKAHRWRVLMAAAIEAFDKSSQQEQTNLARVLTYWAKLSTEARMCVTWVAALVGGKP